MAIEEEKNKEIIEDARYHTITDDGLLVLKTDRYNSFYVNMVGVKTAYPDEDIWFRLSGPLNDLLEYNKPYIQILDLYLKNLLSILEKYLPIMLIYGLNTLKKGIMVPLKI